ncbi:MAG: lysophospholipid acyltransferase family protein [Actinomycetota bacterium]
MRGGELNRWWRVGLALTRPIVWLVFRVRVTGLEHVPRTGPVILAFNHVSVLDGPVLAIETGRRIRRELRFLVAAEVFRHRFYGWVLRHYDQISVRRGEGDAAAVEDAAETVTRGAVVAMAPEGRVDDQGGAQGLQRIKSGVPRIALPTGAPVVPVGIWGTQRRWPRAGIVWRRPIRPRVGLAFGPPLLPFGEADDGAALETFRERLRAHLEAQVTQAKLLAGIDA